MRQLKGIRILVFADNSDTAFLLMIPALGRYGRSRLVTGAALAILIVVLVNLMHFSQGWVQFGYRFSNDFLPFAIVLVADRLAAVMLLLTSVLARRVRGEYILLASGLMLTVVTAVLVAFSSLPRPCFAAASVGFSRPCRHS